MTWQTPSFCEIKMDAEIGSYQEERDDQLDVAGIIPVGLENVFSPQLVDSQRWVGSALVAATTVPTSR
jgi:hypothetical protein